MSSFFPLAAPLTSSCSHFGSSCVSVLGAVRAYGPWPMKRALASHISRVRAVACGLDRHVSLCLTAVAPLAGQHCSTSCGRLCLAPPGGGSAGLWLHWAVAQ